MIKRNRLCSDATADPIAGLYDEHALASRGEAGGQIDGGGGFSHAAFLIRDRDDFGWHFAELNEKCGGVSSAHRTKLSPFKI
jgi:hypothetical protein